jgi:hypothetical protein
LPTVTAPSGTQWCFVSLTITDVATSDILYSSLVQFAYDSQTNQFPVSTIPLSIGPTADPDAIGTTLVPGQSLTVSLPFELPVGDRIAYLQLYGGALNIGGYALIGLGSS